MNGSLRNGTDGDAMGTGSDAGRTSELNKKLEELANETGATKSELLRKAIALMEVAVDAKRRGKKFGIAESDEQLTTEIIGL